jgi:hypothetical protein
MKRVIRLNENDLEKLVKKVLEEQSKPIPINLYQDPNAADKYCKQLKVPKQFVDSEIPNLVKKLNNKVDKEIAEKFDRYPEFETIPNSKKYKKLIEITVGKIKPYLESISTNGLYKSFGYGDYNPQSDSNKIMEIIYSALYNELQSDFKVKMLANAFINKKNVGKIKKIFLDVLSELSRAIDIALVAPSNYSQVIVRNNFYKVAPLCKEVIVVVDESLNKLTPSKQYHPKHPVYWKPSGQIDVDQLVKPYIPKINQIIDSFV